MPERFQNEAIRDAIDQLTRLREATLDLLREQQEYVMEAALEARYSAENLIRYLAVRQHDLRPLQEELSRLGLSSLGRMEAHVDATLCSVLIALHRIAGEPFEEPKGFEGEEGFTRGDSLLTGNASRILGEPEPDRLSRIMVTMPTEAADDPRLIRDLVEAGMNVMRINCAHDSPEVWKRMVTRLEEAREETGRQCLISFDLGGPKLRTGPLEPGPAVRRFKPVRDAFGRVLEPAKIRLVPVGPGGLETGAGCVPVVGDFSLLAGGDLSGRDLSLRLVDSRERVRVLRIEEASEHSLLLSCLGTAYVVPGAVFSIREGRRVVGEFRVAPFEEGPRSVELRPGDLLRVRHGLEQGRNARRDASGSVIEPARISCDFEALFRDCRVGEPILFDDGMVAGRIEEIGLEELSVRIEKTAKIPARLREDKGINLPESRLSIPALTPKDLSDLALACEDADMVSLSFVREPRDIEELVAELDRLGASDLGIVLKIETRQAFENLGPLLLTALRHPPVAVMIARGDLGVEVGFERMAEMQEEILWLCEAAHVPVIWATQVLESLAKKGLATRAEVTDAAMSSRAECVMLNKGPHIDAAVRTLASILRRMKDHQSKKSAQMRRLRVARWSGGETTDATSPR